MSGSDYIKEGSVAERFKALVTRNRKFRVGALCPSVTLA